MIDEMAEDTQTTRLIAVGLVLGVAGAFILMSIGLGSYVRGMVVVGAIPFALIGAVWAHLLFRIDVSIMSILGFGVLIAVAVADATLITGSVMLEEESESRRDSWCCQCRAMAFRLFLTCGGLVPSCIVSDKHGQALLPFIASVTVGLAITSILVLIVTPCLNLMADHLGLTLASQSAGGAE